MKQKKSLLIFLMMLAAASAFAQGRISGVVVDPEGEPLPGVAVISTADGSSSGVITDADGNFSIVAAPGALLEFNCLGFKNVTIGASNGMSVVLEEDKTILDEAVVIGYGTVKKKDLLGSVSTVREAALQDRKSGGVISSMQGLVPGVNITSSGQPGSYASIQIRGIGSFTGNAPLFIVDGSYGGNELGLNVEDIESIQVLKDASSASIYGSRAASGVIIITTKKGRANGLKVKFDGSAQVYWLPRYDLMDAETYKFYDDMAYDNAIFQGVSGVKHHQNHYENDTDWQDAMLKTGILQNYNVSLSGGGKDVNYYASINYKDDGGALQYTGFNQIGFRLNTSGRKGIFEFGENFFFTYSNTHNLNGNPWKEFIDMPPTVPIYDESHRGGYGYGNADRANTYALNPLAENEFAHGVNLQRYMYGDIYGKVDLIKGILNAKVNVSYKNYFGQTDLVRKKGNWAMGQGDDAAHIQYSTAIHNKILVEPTLNYAQQIGKHNIGAVVGFSYDYFKEDYKGETKLDPLMVGDKYITSFNSATGNQTCTGSYIEYALMSYFGRINYSYDDRYLLQLTGRRDGTSRLPEGHRWGTFGSASIGWRISKESFFDVPWIDELKLRANLGTLGNSNIGAWDYQATINTAARAILEGDTKVIGKTQSNLTNNDLVWEKKMTANAGVDMAFLGTRLTASAEYYYSKSSELLLAVPILMTTGNEGGSPTVNAGSLQNQGFEFEAGWHDTIGDFTYSISGNLSTTHNKILSLGYSTTVQYTSVSKSEVGQPLGMWYLYKMLGIFQDKDDVRSHVNSEGKIIQPDALPGDIIYEDYNDDGQIASEDRQVIEGKSPWAKLYAGLSFSCAWKGLDFTLTGYGR
ncbi:MAG: SusC/RagA family TonB-linked outer membrane protein, partial [Bacteroidales bacterium]|nr:SusC/RagA family TonB-linked outer membrane protein [Bacteroidales bacterium]